MKLYLIDNDMVAKQYKQLLKLSGECTKLQWSRTITDVPTDVIESLETIQNYVELKLEKFCTEETKFAELNEEEEEYLFSLFKQSSFLKEIVGSGVILAGEQAQNVLKEIEQDSKLKVLSEALKSGKNIILL